MPDGDGSAEDAEVDSSNGTRARALQAEGRKVKINAEKIDRVCRERCNQAGSGGAMNRQLRRLQQKQRKKAKVDLMRQIDRSVQKAVNDDRVEALMMAFVLTLHGKYGFGQKRCLDVLNHIDDIMGDWIKDSEETERRWRERVNDEIGIRLKF